MIILMLLIFVITFAVGLWFLSAADSGPPIIGLLGLLLIMVSLGSCGYLSGQAFNKAVTKVIQEQAKGE